MAGISVIDTDGDIQEFADASTWHIDDRGQLHLNSAEGKQIASFAKDCWQGAGTSESSVPAFNAQLAYTAELEEVHAALRTIRVDLNRLLDSNVAEFEKLLNRRDRAAAGINKAAQS